MQYTSGYVQTLPPPVGPCPCCGRCPVCGQYKPADPSPKITWGIGGSTGVYMENTQSSLPRYEGTEATPLDYKVKYEGR